jgi:hypothetical protein
MRSCFSNPVITCTLRLVLLLLLVMMRAAAAVIW